MTTAGIFHLLSNPAAVSIIKTNTEDFFSSFFLWKFSRHETRKFRFFPFEVKLKTEKSITRDEMWKPFSRKNSWSRVGSLTVDDEPERVCLHSEIVFRSLWFCDHSHARFHLLRDFSCRKITKTFLTMKLFSRSMKGKLRLRVCLSLFIELWGEIFQGNWGKIEWSDKIKNFKAFFKKFVENSLKLQNKNNISKCGQCHQKWVKLFKMWVKLTAVFRWKRPSKTTKLSQIFLNFLCREKFPLFRFPAAFHSKEKSRKTSKIDFMGRSPNFWLSREEKKSFFERSSLWSSCCARSNESMMPEITRVSLPRSFFLTFANGITSFKWCKITSLIWAQKQHDVSGQVTTHIPVMSAIALPWNEFVLESWMFMKTQRTEKRFAVDNFVWQILNVNKKKIKNSDKMLAKLSIWFWLIDLRLQVVEGLIEVSR